MDAGTACDPSSFFNDSYLQTQQNLRSCSFLYCLFLKHFVALTLHELHEALGVMYTHLKYLWSVQLCCYNLVFIAPFQYSEINSIFRICKCHQFYAIIEPDVVSIHKLWACCIAKQCSCELTGRLIYLLRLFCTLECKYSRVDHGEILSKYKLYCSIMNFDIITF